MPTAHTAAPMDVEYSTRYAKQRAPFYADFSLVFIPFRSVSLHLACVLKVCRFYVLVMATDSSARFRQADFRGGDRMFARIVYDSDMIRVYTGRAGKPWQVWHA